MKALLAIGYWLLAVGLVLPAGAEPGWLFSYQADKDAEPSADPGSVYWTGLKGVFIEHSILGSVATNRHAEVRSRWTTNYLYLLFIAQYDALNLKTNADTTTETDRLWFYDCVEAYIGGDAERPSRYRELQMSPQGEFLDLDIDSTKPRPGYNGEQAWNSGMKVKARINEAAKIWCGEMRVPMNAIDSRPARAGNELRVNFFRQDGRSPHRTFLAWQPTGVWNPHHPEKFGTLKLEK